MILTEFIDIGGSGAVMYAEDVYFSITLPQLALICCGLPASAFVLCVLLALMMHFESSTKTHCNVPNYLPSISAAIGDNTPERYIWRFAIALHCLPRLMTARAYKIFYQRSPLVKAATHANISLFQLSLYDLLCNLVFVLHLVENFFLLSLTFVSSSENYKYHEFSFIAFTVSAQLYMLLSLIIFNMSGRRRSSTSGRKSYQCKFIFYSFNSSSLVISTYFFWRHNAYCEPGVYTLFALCEYVVVLTNIAFHSTAAIDFKENLVVMTTRTNLELKHH